MWNQKKSVPRSFFLSLFTILLFFPCRNISCIVAVDSQDTKDSRMERIKKNEEIQIQNPGYHWMQRLLLVKETKQNKKTNENEKNFI